MVEQRSHGRQGLQRRQRKKQATAADETETRGAKEARQSPGQEVRSRKCVRRSWARRTAGLISRSPVWEIMSDDAHARPTGNTPEPLYDVKIATPTHAERAQTLVAQISTGTLCTLALEPEGYPYGSFVTVAFENGDPIFLISRLAEHTKNLERDPRASLLVAEGGSADPLANGRVTMLGPCTRVGEDGGRARATF